MTTNKDQLTAKQAREITEENSKSYKSRLTRSIDYILQSIKQEALFGEHQLKITLEIWENAGVVVHSSVQFKNDLKWKLEELGYMVSVDNAGCELNISW